MKYLVLFFLFFGISAHSQVRSVTTKKGLKRIKRVINQDDINRLNLETKIVGKTALPALYRFKNKQLILNGAGLRELTWLGVDIYACGLYLKNPETDASAIINSDELMIVRLDVVSKLVTNKKMISALEKGFEDANNETTVNYLKPKLSKFMSFIDGIELKMKDKLDVVYEPNIGISLYMNYKKLGTIEGLGFKKAMFRIWLSENPVDKSLKPELLDGATDFIKD